LVPPSVWDNPQIGIKTNNVMENGSFIIPILPNKSIIREDTEKGFQKEFGAILMQVEESSGKKNTGLKKYTPPTTIQMGK
jgi:hypothetical protein